jgi:hypothetical protein
MRSLIVGSHALKVLGVCNREPKDIDWWCDDPFVRHLNMGRVDHLWHPSFLEFIPETTSTQYATLDQMYTIKLSHSHWELKNGSWNKHVYDMMQLKNAGAHLDMELYHLLYKVWEEMYGKKVMNLDQDKSEFFDDAVKRKYDHDSIHASVAFGDHPIYEDILKDGATVDIDSKKLWAMPHERVVKLFIEEVCVTALERIVIPRNYKTSPGAAYLWALRRTVTSLTKGKSSRFMLENFEEFATPDPDYVTRHRDNAWKLVKL